jgi:glycosyltransferase involved in cell wall biosynthesis
VNSWGTFHVLDVSSIPAFEFARALGQLVPTLAWRQQMRWFSMVSAAGSAIPSEVIDFPLQRGYAHPLLAPLIRFHRRLLPRMLARCQSTGPGPLICTAPFFAPLAERWPGPVVYYSLDFTFAYQGLRPHQVLALDRRLCRAARVVCPVSERIADYLTGRAACEPGKIQILPNATRASNVRETFSDQSGALPSALHGLTRPVAGIIGNLAANLDWELLRSVIERTPEFSWAFIGPASMAISNPAQRRARAALLKHGGRIRFTGSQPYGALQQFARSFDVAILPYRFGEPTRSGSATRFYEHLAACRPMLSTPHVAELQTKQPLVSLASDANAFVSKLNELQAAQFHDGHERARWLASRHETWEQRAQTLLDVLQLEPRRG